MRSQNTHSDGVWAPGTLINLNKMLPWAGKTKIRVSVYLTTRITCGSSIPRGDRARSDQKVHADLIEWTTAQIRRMILDGKYITT